ncbi:AAA family ATPase [Pleomorphomonas carboxyditropha]|nr:AAA family ATPase [Pleomorphomonas carboxyditropha]
MGAQASAIQVHSAADLLRLDIPKREPMLGSWLADRQTGMIYAEAGLGKSMLALAMALAVAGGGTLFGLWEAPRPRRVLIVDGEMDLIDLRERLEVLMPTIPGIDREAALRNIQFVARLGQTGGDFIDIASPEGRETVLQLAADQDAALVFFDNLSTLATVGDENAASSFDPVLSLLVALKAEGRTSILIHHANKKGGYRGTSKMTVPLNIVIHLTRPQGLCENGGAAFEVSFEKVRSLRGDDTKRFTTKLEDGRWTTPGSGSDQIDQLVAMVRSGHYRSDSALAKALNVDRSTVSRRKSAAIAAGKIDKAEWDRCLSETRPN